MEYSNKKTQLKPYQVGDNDIVFAYSVDEALTLLNDYCGQSYKREDMDIIDLSNSLDMKMTDEEGNKIGTLGESLKGCEQPQYFVGWE